MTLVLTRHANMRTMYDERLDKNENKTSNKGVFNAFRWDSESIDSILPADAKEIAMKAFNNTMQAPVHNRFTTTVLTTRPVTTATTTGTSALSTISFVTKGFGITINPAYYENNEIKMQQEFNRQYKAGVEAVAIVIENLMIAALDSNINVIYGQTDTANTKYSLVGNVVQVSQAKKYGFIYDMSVITEELDFSSDNMIVMAKTGFKGDLAYAANQGLTNGTNYSYQFDGKNFFFSNRIASGTSGNFQGYFCPTGTLGILTRNDIDSQLGSRTSDGHEWTIVQDPITGLMMDLYYYETAEDASSIDASASGNTATRVEKYRYAIDVALVLPYNSNAGTTVTDEAVTLTALGTAYALTQGNIGINSVVVQDATDTTTYTETTDYIINYATGTITGVDGGAITAGDVVHVDFVWGTPNAVCKFQIMTA